MILEEGTLLNNRYRIIKILGQGGMASVYQAVDENLGIEVAVKDNLFTTEEYSQQFRREATILAKLRHPNLPRVSDHFVIEKQGQYLVMDYIEGEDLRARMDREGVISEEEAVVIGAAVCEALAYLGSRKPPIVHRDIKPGNIRITPQGQIYLVDFGLAKTLLDAQITATGARAMTPGFSPPEQYGTARTDLRSDIYSLGATIYTALSGVIPEDALARAMNQTELTPIRKHNPQVSERLEGFIGKALELLPEDRFQTAEEFKQAFLSVSSQQRLRSGEYKVEPPPGGIESALESSGEGPKLTVERYQEPSIEAGLKQPQRNQVSPKTGARRKPSWGWVFLILFLLMLSALGILVYQFEGNFISGIFRPPQTTVAALVPSDSPDAVIEVITTTSVVNSPSATGLILSASSTSTSTSAPTTQEVVVLPASPTDTPIPQPTPIGGGGGQIAFASDSTGENQIFVINIDGTGRRQVTDLPGGACQPDWSPDGTRIVFISPCDRNQEQYPGSALSIIEVESNRLSELPTVTGGDFDPKWSPDGSRIAFTSLRNSPLAQLFILSLEDNSVTALSHGNMNDFQPSWSPDGEKIILVSDRFQGEQIWVMNADGQNPRLFSRNQGFSNSHPSWSLDNNTVLFTQTREGGVPRVTFAPNKFVETGNEYAEYRIGQAELAMQEGMYSPDCNWVVFEGWEAAGDRDIYIIAVTDSPLLNLTSDSSYDFDPAWKPTP